MAIHFSTLLILTGLTGICCVTTVSEVSVKTGDSVTIPCLYDREYINHVKGLCEGYYWNQCSFAVKTNQPDRSGRFSISDDKNQRIFTVTMKRPTNRNTDYWCAVEKSGSDIRHYFHLSVTSTPSLYVDHQEVTGIIGENVTINCHYSNTGIMRWCRLGKNCVTGPSGSIDGTRVTIDARPSKVFTVTMSELNAESSGWYWCSIGNFQMPVHVTVSEKPTTTTNSYSTDVGTIPTVANGQSSTSVDLKSLIIPLSLLVFIVIVAFIVWFMLRHKQIKASSTEMADEEIMYSTVNKKKTSSQADEEIMYSTVNKKKTSSQVARSAHSAKPQEDATYSNVEFTRKSSRRKSNPENDVVMYSSVVTIKKPREKGAEAKDVDVTYSTLAEHHRNI
uniref:Immunoglobulin domain-containing protein n=1 Tax=Amphiprion percula TaxID=161767 RepID=A0A3P8SRI2_AMPPE